jgi:hypothetical protein
MSDGRGAEGRTRQYDFDFDYESFSSEFSVEESHEGSPQKRNKKSAREALVCDWKTSFMCNTWSV